MDRLAPISITRLNEQIEGGHLNCSQSIAAAPQRASDSRGERARFASPLDLSSFSAPCSATGAPPVDLVSMDGRLRYDETLALVETLGGMIQSSNWVQPSMLLL